MIGYKAVGQGLKSVQNITNAVPDSQVKQNQTIWLQPLTFVTTNQITPVSAAALPLRNIHKTISLICSVNTAKHERCGCCELFRGGNTEGNT